MTSVTAARAALSSTMAFPGGVGGDEGLEGEVVDGAGVVASGGVDERDGIVAEKGVGPAGELEVVGDVAGGFLAGHGGHGVAQSHPLLQGGEDGEFHGRRRVGWPTSRQASGESASRLWFVNILMASSCS